MVLRVDPVRATACGSGQTSEESGRRSLLVVSIVEEVSLVLVVFGQPTTKVVQFESALKTSKVAPDSELSCSSPFLTKIH